MSLLSGDPLDVLEIAHKNFDFTRPSVLWKDVSDCHSDVVCFPQRHRWKVHLVLDVAVNNVTKEQLI